ncbi:MAG: DUF4198 domain-containing protein [Candidatus Accumulibacter sp.]|jgi:hypothetical protein|nr:DUF4198 domain-containing protein [Accumulibacter sp.]
MKHQKLSLDALLAALALGLSATASAHGLPYVLPFQFHTDQDVVTLYAGNSERYFEPEIPGGNSLNGYYDITVTHPAGETDHVEQISRHRQLTLIEIDTKEAGTYKVERTQISRVFPSVAYQGKSVDVVEKASLDEEERKSREAKKIEDGERRFFFDDEVKPEEIVPVQYVNHITAYVTRGKPSAPKIAGKGFEFDFRTHPNEVSVPSGLQFVALVDGKAAAGITFKIYRQGSEEVFRKVQSDRAGLVDVRFEQAGVYVLSAQAPLESVRNGKVVNPRYINWLVLEVKP